MARRSALVVLDGVLDGVEAVDGDGVELPPLHFVADVAVALVEICLVLLDVVPHARRDLDFFAGGHDVFSRRGWRCAVSCLGWRLLDRPDPRFLTRSRSPHTVAGGAGKSRGGSGQYATVLQKQC